MSSMSEEHYYYSISHNFTIFVFNITCEDFSYM